MGKYPVITISIAIIFIGIALFYLIPWVESEDVILAEKYHDDIVEEMALQMQEWYFESSDNISTASWDSVAIDEDICPLDLYTLRSCSNLSQSFNIYLSNGESGGYVRLHAALELFGKHHSRTMLVYPDSTVWATDWR